LTLYPVRREKVADLAPERLRPVLEELFGPVRTEGAVLHASYGAIRDLLVSPEGKEVDVHTVMDPKVPAEVQAETVRRYNVFLERVTGFSAKERASRMRKAAQAGTQA
jgi:hypothetical protein